MKQIAATILALGLAACAHASQTSPATEDIGGRELRPPRAGITVGSLYFVREKPTDDLSRPANLERLCDVNLTVYGVETTGPVRVADIDLMSRLEANGSLGGIATVFVKAGLQGNISRYFEYKLINVTQTDISLNDAENIYANRAFRKDCAAWRQNIGALNWGKYQIIAIKVGDLSFARKSISGASADITAKLNVVEPALKAELRRETGATFSGKGLVAVFSPISRN